MDRSESEEEIAGPPGLQPPWLHLLHAGAVVAGYLALYMVFFSPVLITGKLLASSGDALLFYLPNFLLGPRLWEPLTQCGFPVAADPQAQTWYPLSFLFSAAHSWNGFIISAYVLASSFAYALVYSLTRCRLAAVITGTVYGLSGFMIVHQSHVSILHAAAWMPLFIWSLEQLRQGLKTRWLLTAAAAVALCALAGFPQVLANMLLLGGGFVLLRGWSMRERFRFWAVAGLAVALGLGLAAIQLAPTAELAGQAMKGKATFAEMISFSLPPRQLVTILYPMSFGGSVQSFYGEPYRGAGNLVELTGYVGLLSLMLGGLGLREWKVSSGWVWACLALAFLVLALGDATPVVRLVFLVPVLNKFHAPARHLLEVSLALSVLAGLGVSAAMRARAVRTAIVVGALGLMMALGLVAGGPGARSSMVPWTNPALGVPVLVFAVSALGLAVWVRRTTSRARQALLALIVVADLGSFGYFQYWRFTAASGGVLEMPEFAARYRTVLERTHQRMVPVKGGSGHRNELPPNLSTLWGIPSANGFGPLILSRASDTLSMDFAGALTRDWASPQDCSLDVAAGRFVFVPGRYREDSDLDEGGIPWTKEELDITLGSSPTAEGRTSWKLQLKEPVPASAVGIISTMGSSASINEGEDVVSVRVTDSDGQATSASLLAGRDTSEWAWECDDVRPHVAHRQAPIFVSFPIVRPGRPTCQGHLYRAILPLGRPRTIEEVELTWQGRPGVVHLKQITLVDEKRGRSTPVSKFMAHIGNSERWRLEGTIGEVSVYENLRALPRAWLVGAVTRLGYRQIVQAVRTSRLPDGSPFDPLHMALVEDVFGTPGELDGGGSARVVSLADTAMEVETKTSSTGFLVTSDAFYPGWRVTVDGDVAHLFVADGLLRGVEVPAGEHRVRFSFQPRSLRLGAGVTLCSLVAAIALATHPWRRLWQPADGRITTC